MRRQVRAALTVVVRGRRTRGGPWGEALLAEYDEVVGDWAAVRWACGGLRTALQERAAAIRRPYRTVLMGGMVFVAVLAVGQFAMSPRYMPSPAMAPTVRVGGHFVVDKVGFHLTGLHHADVVEFPIPHGGADGMTIKRVLGLAGDRIDCRDGRVLRNGAPVDEPYLPPGSSTECAPLTVPDGTVYVLGDNRGMSADSRDWGPVGEAAIDGRVLFTLD